MIKNQSAVQCTGDKMRLSIKRFRNSADKSMKNDVDFYIGSIDPRLPASILSILQILFSLACLITACVYIDGFLRASPNVETCVVLGLGVLVFVIQIILSSCTLYAFYANHATVILCQAVWQVLMAIFAGILCAVIINKFVTSTILIGYILMGVTLVSTPICAVDACMILIFFKSYQLMRSKHRNRSMDSETKFTSTPATTLTLSSANNSSSQPVDFDECIPVECRKSPKALLPPVPVIRPPFTEPVRRHPSQNRAHVYSIYGRNANQHRSIHAASYSSMRWTQGENFAELIHRTPTGQFVLNLREEGVDGWNTEA